MISDAEVKSHLSENLKRILSGRGLSGRWLMQQVGLKEGTFYPVYNGEVVPGVAVTKRIADALGVTVDDLLRAPRKNNRKNS